MRHLLLICAIAPVFAAAQSITTALPNNGSGGVFMHLTPTTQSLQMTSFSTYFGNAAGSAVSVQVWTRPGAYAGFTASNAGWTLHETVSGISNGNASLSSALNLTNSINLGVGSTTSVYLHSITTGGGIWYTGLNATPPQTTWSNADLTLFSDVTRTGAVAFAGTQFTPRTFAGTVNYTAVPEPATMAAIGMGVALLARRRRKA